MVLAIDVSMAQAERADEPAAAISVPERLTDADLKRASELTGDSVTNRKGETLGKISDLIIDTDTGNVAYIIVSGTGEGLANKRFAIPAAAMHTTADEDKVILDLDKERLARAPAFEGNDWPEMASEDWVSEVHEYYG
jgi:sporulation protein YlmC with PRC-barrel domain